MTITDAEVALVMEAMREAEVALLYEQMREAARVMAYLRYRHAAGTEVPKNAIPETP